jgi:N-acetylglutamate synthase-like GNAT family acetyltransferase
MNHRQAVVADVPMLNAVALAAKAHWGYTAEQLQAWRDDLEVQPDSLESRPVFVAEMDDQVAGFVQLAADVEPWEVCAMWVSPDHMDRGLGTSLLAQACRVAAAAGQRELYIDSEPNAEGFYRACGARVVGHVAAPIAGHPRRKRPQLVLATRAA